MSPHQILLTLVCAFPSLLAAQIITAPTTPIGGTEVSIRKAVDSFLRGQMQGLPGQASYQIDAINTQALPPCHQFSVTATPGAKPWGRSSVSVRCIGGANWSLLVPVRIQVVGNYLVTARGIAPGQLIGAGDLIVQTGDLGDLPGGVLTDTTQAIGQIARSTLPAGRTLTGDLLRAPNVVQQGQNIRVVSRGSGFQVSNEGRALGNASAGQVVQVRLANGQVVSGIADTGGIVEIGN